TLSLIGDIDCDGGVGKMADIVLLAKYFKGVIKLDSQALTNAQCTKGDTTIDTEDLSTLINYLLGVVNKLPI
ncbi:MAG: hypothetical protein LBM93_01945, partial [Oscillospiraceae bacterium]|nr:hypothetical protein [Oscillospiraceae bacterium]